MKSNAEPHAEHTFLKAYAGDFNGDGRTTSSFWQTRSTSIARTARSWTSCSTPSSGCAKARGSSSPATASTSATSTATARTRSPSPQRHGLDHGVPRPPGRRRRKQAQADRPVRQLDAELGLHPWRQVLRRGLQRGRQEGSVRLQRRTGQYLRRMLRSTGAGFNLVRRYDANMPGWQMRPADRHYVGDFTGNGREVLWVFNGSNWSIPYLGMLRSTGSALAMSKRYGYERTRLADAAGRPLLRGRLHRRREGRPLRLQRDELVDRLPRHAPVDRLPRSP